MIIERLGNEAEEQVSVASDVESIVTHYCKSCGQQYERNNGWLDILQPLLTLRLNRSSLYNCFYSILTNYIPKYVKSSIMFCDNIAVQMLLIGYKNDLGNVCILQGCSC